MKRYFVTFEMDIPARDHEEAARGIFAHLQNADDIEPFRFDVIEEDCDEPVSIHLHHDEARFPDDEDE